MSIPCSLNKFFGRYFFIYCIYCIEKSYENGRYVVIGLVNANDVIIGLMRGLLFKDIIGMNIAIVLYI